MQSQTIYFSCIATTYALFRWILIVNLIFVRMDDAQFEAYRMNGLDSKVKT